MIHFVRTHALCRAALLLAFLPSYGTIQAQIQQTHSAPTDDPEQFLVLHDGGVLTGRIEREGERYLVTQAGLQLEVPAHRVQLVSDSLEEAYQHRRRQSTHWTAEAHLDLAEWCLRHDLVPQARRELSDARALDGRHPRLALLERRLTHASRASSGAAVATSPTAQPAPENTQPRQIEQAAALEASPRIVERFTRKVQPVLVNNCTTAGCHQPGGAQLFQFDRALLHGLANRRSTMSNLAATLQLIDRVQPESSPLLTVPRRAHGGMDEAIFGPRQEQAFRHLEEWVALVTQSEASEPAISAQALAADHAQQFDVAATNTPSVYSVVEPASSTSTAGAGEIMQAEFIAAAPLLDQQSPRLRIGAQVEKWQPRDPFDPETFNRRVLAKAPESEPVRPH